MAPRAPPFPESATLDRNKLRARLNKKVKGGNYLTKDEMEELTVRRAHVDVSDSQVSWKPYRSVGACPSRLCYACRAWLTTHAAVWLLWSLADGQDSSI